MAGQNLVALVRSSAVKKVDADGELAAAIVQVAVLHRAGEKDLAASMLEEVRALVLVFGGWPNYRSIPLEDVVAAGVEIGGAL